MNPVKRENDSKPEEKKIGVISNKQNTIFMIQFFPKKVGFFLLETFLQRQLLGQAKQNRNIPLLLELILQSHEVFDLPSPFSLSRSRFSF